MNSARLLLFISVLLLGVIIVSPAQAQSATLTGPVSEEEILASERIFDIYIKRYQPDEEALSFLKAYQDSVELIVFFGSWCRESKKYVPALMKTLQMADSDIIQTKYIGVDDQKIFPKEFLKKFDIKYIPTVVILVDNKEVGRIVEEPNHLIETDLVQILKKAALKK